MQANSYRAGAKDDALPMVPQVDAARDIATLAFWQDAVAIKKTFAAAEDDTIRGLAKDLCGRDDEDGVARCLALQSSFRSVGQAESRAADVASWVEAAANYSDSAIAAANGAVPDAVEGRPFVLALAPLRLALCALAASPASASGSAVDYARRCIVGGNSLAAIGELLDGNGDAGLPPHGFPAASLTLKPPAPFSSGVDSLITSGAASKLFVATQLTLVQFRAAPLLAAVVLAHLAQDAATAIPASNAKGAPSSSSAIAAVIVDASLSLCAPAVGFAPVSVAFVAGVLCRLSGCTGSSSTRVVDSGHFAEAVVAAFDALFEACVLRGIAADAVVPQSVSDALLFDALPELLSQFGYEWVFAAWSAAAAKKSSGGDPDGIGASWNRFCTTLLGRMATGSTYPDRLDLVLPGSVKSLLPLTPEDNPEDAAAMIRMPGAVAHYSMQHSQLGCPAPLEDCVATLFDELVKPQRLSGDDIAMHVRTATDVSPYVVQLKSVGSANGVTLTDEMRSAAISRYRLGVLLTAALRCGWHTLSASSSSKGAVPTLALSILRRSRRVIESWSLDMAIVDGAALASIGVFDAEDVAVDYTASLPQSVRDVLPGSLSGNGLGVVAHVVRHICGGPSDPSAAGMDAFRVTARLRRVVDLFVDMQGTGGGRYTDRSDAPASLLSAADWAQVLALALTLESSQLHAAATTTGKRIEGEVHAAAWTSSWWLRQAVLRALAHLDDALVRLAEVDPNIPAEVAREAHLTAAVFAALARESPFGETISELAPHLVLPSAASRENWKLVSVDTRRCVTQQQAADRVAASFVIAARIGDI